MQMIHSTNFQPPQYFRLDSQKMIGCELDFAMSGFTDTKICGECGSVSYDHDRTYQRQHTDIVPYVIKEGSWNGENIFSPKYMKGLMYCTDKVVTCASKHQLTNFYFCPLELVNCTDFKGVKYNQKNWMTNLPKQIEQFKKDFYAELKNEPNFPNKAEK